MVRGRRTRRAATGSTSVAQAGSTTAARSPTTMTSSSNGLTTNGSLAVPANVLKMVSKVEGGMAAGGVILMADDFSCASPKRKEYKIDELLMRNGATSNGFTNGCSMAAKTTTTNAQKTRMVLRGNGVQHNPIQSSQTTSNINVTGSSSTNGKSICPGAGNGITRFLLNQAKSKSRKTRKKSPNFELVNDDTCDSFTHATSLQEAPEVTQNGNGMIKMETMDEEEVVMVVVKEEEEEREEEDLENNDQSSVGKKEMNGNTFPFQLFGRLPIGGTEAPEGNIFLQEPVLKLTVDEAACVLVPGKKKNGEKENGKNGITTTTVKGEQPTMVVNGASVAAALINQDSNSGDSGVVIDKLQEALIAAISPKASPLLAVQGRQRKPTTPHRIFCPSSPQVNGIKEESAMGTDSANDRGPVEEKDDMEENGGQMTKRKLLLPTKDNAAQQDLSQMVVDQKSIKTESKPMNGCTKAPQMTTATSNATTNGHHTHQSTMEDFFKVRRSVRKTKKEVEREEQMAIEKAILAAEDTDLAVKLFDNKGRGIVTTRPFAKGEFVVEYIGEFISIAEANKREKIYAQDQGTGCYMYYFKHRNKQYCIDATEETGKLGRLVNHSRNGNLMTRTVEVKGQPHLVLIAKEDIEAGRELTYDYGDRSKESLLHHPWLAN